MEGKCQEPKHLFLSFKVPMPLPLPLPMTKKNDKFLPFYAFSPSQPVNIIQVISLFTSCRDIVVVVCLLL